MKQLIILGVILVVALVARLHRIGEPLADWHSWRQADTVTVTKRFVSSGMTTFPAFPQVLTTPKATVWLNFLLLTPL